MAQINLLPDSLRHKKREAKKKSSALPSSITLIDRLKFLPKWIKWAYLGSFVFFLLVEIPLIAAIRSKGAKLTSFKGQEDKLSGGSKEIVALEEKKKIVESKTKLIENITLRKLSLARQLNLISDLLPDGVWITRVYFEFRKDSRGGKSEDIVEKPALTVEGRVYSQEQNLIDLATDFLNNLRDNSEFSRNFPGLKMGVITKILINKFDILQFQIITEN